MSIIFLIATSFLTFFITFSSSVNTEGLSLLALKFAITADPSGVLSNWSDSPTITPCNWTGVICTGDRVTGLTLTSNGFTGYIPSELGAIPSLRRLILSHNNFSGPIPSHLFSSSLLYLDLSQNALSGHIPQDIQSLTSLIHLDLSLNYLDGLLPAALPGLRNLYGTVNLSFNLFSGEIPPSYGDFPVMVSLDIRHNNLSGKIPQLGSLLNQGPTAFAGNPGLCGFPLQVHCSGDGGNGGVSSTEMPLDPGERPGSSRRGGGRRQWRSGEVMVLCCSGAAVVVFAVSMWVVVVRKKGRLNWSKRGRMEEEDEEEEEGESDKFMIVDDGFVFGMEDLLRSTALVLGKGRSGIVYRVVIGRGSCGPPHAVAVRRLSEEMGALRLREFQEVVESMTRVEHLNVVGIKAYYYGKEEKLLVSDFIGNGSLHTALHGGRTSGVVSPLSWAERLRIARGVAKGLTRIHECAPGKLVHGRIKASKILLDHNLHAYISGFGLTHLASISASNKANQSCMISEKPCAASHVSPEGRCPGGRVTQKGEVYSFGVLLLEMLTGKVVGESHENDWMGIKGFSMEALVDVLDPVISGEKSAISALRIALDCTREEPKLRPRMRRVAESLELL